MDYYELLGVGKNATEAELKTAYRKQALQWHPDRNKTAEAAERFKEINRAYEVLSNAQKRQQYDQFGKEAFERGGGHTGRSQQNGPFNYTYTTNWGQGESPFEGVDFGGFSDPFEIFEQFFGFRSPFGGTSRQRRDLYEVQLSFEDAVRGVEKISVIKGKQRTIKIPAGVDNGTTIRFSDFDVQVQVRPHSKFKREGSDVTLSYDLPFPTAVLGGVVTVPTVMGEEMQLRVRPGTKAGTVVRLRGQGIPVVNSQRRGDQYVIYSIEVPDTISRTAKKLLEELKDELIS